MASRRKEEDRLASQGMRANEVGNIHTGPHASPTTGNRVLDGANEAVARNRRGSRAQRQDAAVGVNVGQLRDSAINQMRSLEPMTVTPNEVDNTGAEGERRIEVKKRGVGDALKNFQ